MIEDDALADAIPESMSDGDATIRFDGTGYVAELGDRDGVGAELSVTTGGRLSASELASRAQDSTEHRALIRDTVEQLSIAEAFERATELSGADSATFNRGLISDMTTLQCLESGLHMSATDSLQAGGFRSVTENALDVKVTRTDAGYRIERTVQSRLDGTISLLVDDVDGQPRRWSS